MAQKPEDALSGTCASEHNLQMAHETKMLQQTYMSLDQSGTPSAVVRVSMIGEQQLRIGNPQCRPKVEKRTPATKTVNHRIKELPQARQSIYLYPNTEVS